MRNKPKFKIGDKVKSVVGKCEIEYQITKVTTIERHNKILYECVSIMDGFYYTDIPEVILELIVAKPQIFTTLEMIAEIYKDKSSKFISGKFCGGVEIVDDVLACIGSKNPFQLTLDCTDTMDTFSINDWTKVVETKEPEYVKFDDWEDSVWYYNEHNDSIFVYKIKRNTGLVYRKFKANSSSKVMETLISYNELVNGNWIEFEE